MASITFEEVSKDYGGVTAVDALSLDIADGEFMVLLGPSGCGKTTALRMIAGLEEISAGTLRLGDQIVNDVEPAKRDVSMVFQSYALYPHMSVHRNIESPLLVRRYHADGPDKPERKLTKGERAERVAEAARALDLEPYMKRKPRQLSGGQRQRVALARAFVGRPKAFLMDEPLSNLDAKLRAQTRRELVDLHRRVATTVVYVTHDQVEAMTMASRIAVMSDGQLQQAGTPEEIYETPANLFVAQFIGSPPMNCLNAAVSSGDADDVALEVDGTAFPVPPGLKTRLAEGQPVVVGVRPEHLAVIGIPDSEGVPITAQLDDVEWLGHERLLFCRCGDQPLLVRQLGVASDSEDGAVRLAVDPANIHVFDPDTQLRLA